jgi:hypothetical protein
MPASFWVVGTRRCKDAGSACVAGWDTTLATLGAVKRPFSDMNPTVRGFALIALVSAAIVALQLESTVVAVSAVLQILFLLAVGFFVYVVWRQQRHAISLWPVRARTAFYAAAALIVADIAAYWFDRPSGPDAVAFILVLALGAFAMWRIWRDQHTYV